MGREKKRSTPRARNGTQKTSFTPNLLPQHTHDMPRSVVNVCSHFHPRNLERKVLGNHIFVSYCKSNLIHKDVRSRRQHQKEPLTKKQWTFHSVHRISFSQTWLFREVIYTRGAEKKMMMWVVPAIQCGCHGNWYQWLITGIPYV